MAFFKYGEFQLLPGNQNCFSTQWTCREITYL